MMLIPGRMSQTRTQRVRRESPSGFKCQILSTRIHRRPDEVQIRGSANGPARSRDHGGCEPPPPETSTDPKRQLKGYPIMADYIYIAQMDIPPELEDDFNRIYDTQHVPEILTVAGVHGWEDKPAKRRQKVPGMPSKTQRSRVSPNSRRSTRSIRRRWSRAPSGGRRSTRATGSPKSAPIRRTASTASTRNWPEPERVSPGRSTRATGSPKSAPIRRTASTASTRNWPEPERVIGLRSAADSTGRNCRNLVVGAHFRAAPARRLRGARCARQAPQGRVSPGPAWIVGTGFPPGCCAFEVLRKFPGPRLRR